MSHSKGSLRRLLSGEAPMRAVLIGLKSVDDVSELRSTSCVQWCFRIFISKVYVWLFRMKNLMNWTRFQYFSLLSCRHQANDCWEIKSQQTFLTTKGGLLLESWAAISSTADWLLKGSAYLSNIQMLNYVRRARVAAIINKKHATSHFSS